MRLRDKEKNEKREKIITVARKLFASKGFESVSINEIAKECGVAKGTIYIYFKNKYELFIEVLKFAEEMTMNRVYKMLNESKDNPTNEKILKVLNIFNDFIKTYPEYISIFMILHNQLPIEVVNKVRDTIKEMQCKKVHVWEVISDIIKEGMEKGEVRKDIDPLQESIKIWFLHITRVISLSIASSKLFETIGGDYLKNNIESIMFEFIDREIKKILGGF